MLYESPCCPSPEAAQLLRELTCARLHYLEQAELLAMLNTRCAMSRAEMSRATGWPVALIQRRMSLTGLESGLRAALKAEGAPEPIAAALLRLPDEITRRRVARRIIRERLCIRDAALLVDAALRRYKPAAGGVPEHRGRVISLVRDHRPYRNAIRDIAMQMQHAGVRADFTERKTGGKLEWTVTLPVRRRRTERCQSM